jgi:hypothetical protein
VISIRSLALSAIGLAASPLVAALTAQQIIDNLDILNQQVAVPSGPGELHQCQQRE